MAYGSILPYSEGNIAAVEGTDLPGCCVRIMVSAGIR